MNATVIGLLRVRNEARWIARVLRSMWPVCSKIMLFDDHSEDGTPEIAVEEGADVVYSPFQNLQEARDKTYLLRGAYQHYGPFGHGEYALMIDGDEALAENGPALIRGYIAAHPGWAFKARIFYLWDSEDTIRIDGVYGRFWRPSLFPLGPEPLHFQSLRSSSGKAQFHCSNIPAPLFPKCLQSNIPLLHYGYLHKQDRIRKFLWYREHDPGNEFEQGYIHVVQGDIPEAPVNTKFMWGGPLKLQQRFSYVGNLSGAAQV